MIFKITVFACMLRHPLLSISHRLESWLESWHSRSHLNSPPPAVIQFDKPLTSERLEKLRSEWNRNHPGNRSSS